MLLKCKDIIITYAFQRREFTGIVFLIVKVKTKSSIFLNFIWRVSKLWSAMHRIIVSRYLGPIVTQRSAVKERNPFRKWKVIFNIFGCFFLGHTNEVLWESLLTTFCGDSLQCRVLTPNELICDVIHNFHQISSILFADTPGFLPGCHLIIKLDTCSRVRVLCPSSGTRHFCGEGT